MEPLMPKDFDLRPLLDAIPSVVFITDGDVRIVEANRAARVWLGHAIEQQPNERGGDLLHCIFARDSQDGCGTTEYCPACVIRKSVEAVKLGRLAPRRVAHMILDTADGSEDRWFQVSASALALEGRELVMLVLEDVSQLAELRELIPFWPCCGNVREVADLRSQAQIFIRKHPDFLSAQELCPDCRSKSPADLGQEEGPGASA
jgi:hypothetical protein